MSDLERYVARDLPEKLSDLDGWTADALVDWLGSTATGMGRLDVKLEEVRVAAGLVLHKLRDELPEGDYGREEERLAALANVHPGTLRRWRARAEEQHGLESPEKAALRAKAAKAAAERKQLRANARSEQQSIEARATEIQRNDPPTEDARASATAEESRARDSAAPDPDERPPSTGRATKPTAPTGSGSAPSTTTETTAAIAAPPSPAEAVARLLTFDADQLSGIDGPSLRKLVELGRGALSKQTIRLEQAKAGACAHPKSSENKQTYGVFCGDCKARLR